MADKYNRIEKPQEVLPSNEIRVKRGVGIGRYLKRAHELLNGPTGSQQTPGQVASTDHIVIKGVSNAVESAVKLAELIKHRIKGLHQLNKISHITIVDEYEPLEEGLDHLKFTRIVTMLEITLSKQAGNTDDVGYQPPIDESEVQEYSERQEDMGDDNNRRRRPRRYNNRGRNGQGRGGQMGGRRQGGQRNGNGQNDNRSQQMSGQQNQNQGRDDGQDGGNRRRRKRGGGGGRGNQGGDQEESKQDGGNTYGANRRGQNFQGNNNQGGGGNQEPYKGGQGQRQRRGGPGGPGSYNQNQNRGNYGDGGQDAGNRGGNRGGGRGGRGGRGRGGGPGQQNDAY